ncbi:hypothetical protein ACFX13_022175 [Malus domestica]|uniref:HMA domain-containing protein n=1 Tax=Malus domestica TaxID=3750 RepID=A0A498HLY6_MALDO|nr:leucine-rich repeat extensin-like protein 3 [Malus domestica]RXH71949.1 hypothetical protein DVH24_025450 [Malus domestica]
MCINKMPPINPLPLPLSLSPSLPPPSSLPLMEKPRVTEIHVRMDCNGCVQKIKKALHGINGIYDLYIDFPQQKLTIIGWADPEKIVKAIKKTRKIATICSHTEQQTEPAPPPPEQAPENGSPAPEAANPPPSEAPPPAEAAPPAEVAPPAEPPRESPRPENPTPEPTVPTPVSAETNPGQQIHHQRPRDVGEAHTIYHHPPDYGYRYDYSQGYNGYWNRYHNSQGPPQEPAHIPAPMGPPPMIHAPMDPPPMSHAPGPPPMSHVPMGPPPMSHSPMVPPPMSHAPMCPTPPPPMHVTHSYNTYRPSPYITEFEYIQPPPQPSHFSRMNHYNEHFSRANHYNEEQHDVNGNGNITSMFSDENPNACTVM